jgi:hypothetical protein
MKMIDVCIQDLKTIQSSYPINSRGYEALRLAIVILTQVHDAKSVAANHWVAGEAGASSNLLELED